MNIVITIDTNNNAFQDGNHEISRILLEIVNKLDNDGIYPLKEGVDYSLFDHNGNSIGRLEVKEEDPKVVYCYRCRGHGAGDEIWLPCERCNGTGKEK